MLGRDSVAGSGRLASQPTDGAGCVALQKRRLGRELATSVFEGHRRLINDNYFCRRIASPDLLPASIVASEFLLPKGGTMSTMSPEGRRELVAAVIERYQRSTLAERGRILDEFVALTGYHRKHGIRVLNGNSATPARPRGRRSVYDEAVTEGLVVLWEASDRVCGKRLKALLPTLVPALERHGHLTLDPRVREQLMAVSAATIDRRLAPARTVTAGQRRRRRAGGDPCGAGFRCARSAIGGIRRRGSSRPTRRAL